jgi:hypothetical protein
MSYFKALEAVRIPLGSHEEGGYLADRLPSKRACARLTTANGIPAFCDRTYAVVAPVEILSPVP